MATGTGSDDDGVVDAVGTAATPASRRRLHVGSDRRLEVGIGIVATGLLAYLAGRHLTPRFDPVGAVVADRGTTALVVAGLSLVGVGIAASVEAVHALSGRSDRWTGALLGIVVALLAFLAAVAGGLQGT